MKKDTKAEKLKREYEKVYENPLNWCPLFGYIPEIEKSHFYTNEAAYKIASDCIDIINGCRENFGIDYRPTYHMKKYIYMPELKTLLPDIDDEGKKRFEALRCLFRNLDYLALKTAHTYTPWIAQQLHNCGFLKVIPNKPIGRTSNHYYNCYSEIASTVEVNQIVDFALLEEAQKITGKDIKLDYIKLFSLYSILEAWLIITDLFFKKNIEAERLLHLRVRLDYANKLIRLADYHSELRTHEADFMEKENIKQKAAPYFKMQSDKAKKKNALTIEKNEPRNEYIKSKTEAYLEKSGKKPAQQIYNHFLKNADIKKEMKEKNIPFNIRLRQFTSIIEPVLNEYKEKK